MPKPQIFSVSLKLLWVQFSGDSGLVALQREGPFFAKPQFSMGQYYTVTWVSVCLCHASVFSKSHLWGLIQILKVFRLLLTSKRGTSGQLSVSSKVSATAEGFTSESSSADFIADRAGPLLSSEKLNDAIKPLKPSLHWSSHHHHGKL